MVRDFNRPENPSGRYVFSDRSWRAIAKTLELSPREFQIVQLIFDDEKEVSIAKEIGLSVHTVHTHLERLSKA